TFGGGIGFASDDPHNPYGIWRGYSRPGNPTYVFDTSGTGRATQIMEWDLTDLIGGGVPTSIAIERASGLIFVSVGSVFGDRNRHAIYVTNDNGVSHWKEVAQIHGRMFFLSGYGLPFVQTNDNLYRFVSKTPTAVSSHQKATMTWGELKRP
ncbi:MAG: hypothetical protein O3A46_01675, partial [Candidatus Poribacteria bacterium]|nr:hypothetical protein [Candidatus Poribacteria bacterium]